ncbi:MAG: hypothetical protein AAF581_09685 [Planctomycetota bacterium]
MKLLCLTVLLFLHPAVGPAVDPDDEPLLELRITSKNLTVVAGGSGKVSAEIVNIGKVAVTLVKPGDGSQDGWRTPLVGWSVLDAKDKDATHAKEPTPRKVARCGNINSLGKKSVFVLEPGKKQAIDDWRGSPTFAKPGKYRVVFYYTNDPAIGWKGLPLGDHDADALAALESSTKCALVSNELVFTVAPKSQAGDR